MWHVWSCLVFTPFSSVTGSPWFWGWFVCLVVLVEFFFLGWFSCSSLCYVPSKKLRKSEVWREASSPSAGYGREQQVTAQGAKNLLHRENNRMLRAAGADSQALKPKEQNLLGISTDWKNVCYISASYCVAWNQGPVMKVRAVWGKMLRKAPYFFSITWNFLYLKTKHSSFYSIKTWLYLVFKSISIIFEKLTVMRRPRRIPLKLWLTLGCQHSTTQHLKCIMCTGNQSICVHLPQCQAK